MPHPDESEKIKSKKIKEDQEDTGIPVYEDRKKEWKDDEKVKDQLSDVYSTVCSGFDDKTEQTETIERAWDIYNCEFNENQSYDGDSKIYLPIVHDAIEARVTRFSNNIFPQIGRYSDVLSADATVPYDIMALLDHYVEQTSLRDVVVPALMRSGDITGQYSLFLSWCKRERHAIKKVRTSVLSAEDMEISSPEDTADIEIETVDDSRPDVMVLDARDLLITPASVDEIDDADVVAVRLRMSKGRVQEMIDNGEFEEEAGEALIEKMTAAEEEGKDSDPAKKNLNAAGVKADGKGNVTALIYLVFTKLKIGGKRRRCMAYLAGDDDILSCKRNPYWSDRIPVITQAALKVNGSVWGKSRVATVEKNQYAANDAINMGMDSIKYSLLPIVAIDPEKNPRSGTVVLTMGAIWQVDPNSMQVIEFPSQLAEAMSVVDLNRSQIMASLGTNPAMMTMGLGGKKPTQAQISQEQQVALEGTADVVTILESSVLNKLLRWFYEMDYQFRSKAVTVRRFGPIGIQAEMQEIPPIGVDTHYTFKWYGTEGQKSAQQVQQMISLLNVMRELPPDQLNGRRIDAGPIIEQAANATFGPRVAPKVLIDQRHSLTINAAEEDLMMAEGFCVKVQPMDDDVEHLREHMAFAKESGDPTGEIRVHIQEHMQQMQAKQAQMSQQQGGQQAIAAPRPGSQVESPTGPQAPAGAIHEDQMQGVMPRERGPG